MRLGAVGQLWRYPVKSLAGVREPHLELDATGPVGDRSYGVVDRASGVLVSAKREGRLLEARVEDRELVLPGGVRAPLGSPDADQALSEWLGRDVRVAHVGEEPSLRQEMHRDNADATSPLVRWRSPRGRYVDVYPLHLVASGTLVRMAEQFPDLDWDPRRFRPNVVVDTEVPEQDWLGGRLRIDGVELSVPDQLTERCVVVTRAQPGLAARRDLLGALASLRGAAGADLSVGSRAALLGCYGEVVRPGTVREGATVELVAPSLTA